MSCNHVFPWLSYCPSRQAILSERDGEEDDPMRSKVLIDFDKMIIASMNQFVSNSSLYPEVNRTPSSGGPRLFPQWGRFFFGQWADRANSEDRLIGLIIL